MGTDAEPEQPSEVKRTRKNLFMSGKLYSDTSMSQCASHTHQIVCGYVCVLYIKHRVYRKEKKKLSQKCSSGLRKDTATSLKKQSQCWYLAGEAVT